ncbi:hypothetical protein K9M18_05980 [Candidatus Woesearchaeota archaeon]|nr:hypothetical protein [Candidatus Woesearchaeota archaeon]MCF8014009.1 hypothetical protein [Candidatus Woesearchaeota archaeon]
MDKKAAQTWVKVLSIIGIVVSALSVIGGIIMVFGGSFLASFLPGGEMFAGIAAVAGIVTIILSGLFVWFHLLLMKYTNWARIVLLVFSILGFLGALFSLNILGIIWYGLFTYIFLFDKGVVGLYYKK